DGTAQVWDTPTGDTIFTFQAFANAVAWSPNSKRIVVANNSSVQVWDATTGASVLIYHGHETNQRELAYGVAWSPDGKYIASTSGVPVATDGGTPSDEMAQVWDATTGEHIYA